MIERGSRAGLGSRGGETPFVLSERVGVERVLPRQVLRVNKGLGAGDPRSELRRSLPRFALALIGVARGGEVSLRQLRPFRPRASGDARAEPDAVSAGRCAEYPRQACAVKPRERIVVPALFERS